MKKISSPALVTDMMANGTTDRLSMSAPGSTPVVNPPATAPLPQLACNGGPASAHVPVSDNADRIRDNAGRFSEDTSAWSMAGGHGGKWVNC